MSSENPNQEEFKMPKKIDLEVLRNMLPDDRINFLKGSVDNYPQKLKQAVDSIIPVDTEEDKILREKIIDAFRMRVEDNFNAPGFSFGGHALDHLPQHGIISDEQYSLLYASAAGLAGKIIEDAGFPEHAKPAYEKYGELMARLNF
jgi:hypothetical protein